MHNSFLPLSSQSLNAFEVLSENQIENWSFHLPLGFPIFFFLGFPIFFFLRQGYVHVTLISFPLFILSTFQLFFCRKIYSQSGSFFSSFCYLSLKVHLGPRFTVLIPPLSFFLMTHISFPKTKKWIEYKLCSRSKNVFSFYFWKNCCTYSLMGTVVAQWLRCCATNRKVAGSIPAGISGFFIDVKSFRSHYGSGVDSASNRNEYQEYFLDVKVAGA